MKIEIQTTGAVAVLKAINVEFAEPLRFRIHIQRKGELAPDRQLISDKKKSGRKNYRR